MKDHVDWTTGGGYADTGSAPKAQVCKPDYERLIAERKATLAVTENMFDATKAYIQHIGSGSRANSLKDLLGHLVIDREALQRRIADLIAEQEKDNTKDRG